MHCTHTHFAHCVCSCRAGYVTHTHIAVPEICLGCSSVQRAAECVRACACVCWVGRNSRVKNGPKGGLAGGEIEPCLLRER